jgi:hypothetical protein
VSAGGVGGSSGYLKHTAFQRVEGAAVGGSSVSHLEDCGVHDGACGWRWMMEQINGSRQGVCGV